MRRLSNFLNYIKRQVSLKNKFLYLFLYLTIYMYSILDFDFAYLVIFTVYIYDSYCNMLTRAEELNGIDYSNKKDEIMNRYYTIEAERSEKSKKRFGQY